MKIRSAAVFLFLLTSLMFSPVKSSNVGHDTELSPALGSPKPDPTPPVPEPRVRPEPRVQPESRDRDRVREPVDRDPVRREERRASIGLEPPALAPAALTFYRAQANFNDIDVYSKSSKVKVQFQGATETEGRLFIHVEPTVEMVANAGGHAETGGRTNSSPGQAHDYDWHLDFIQQLPDEFFTHIVKTIFSRDPHNGAGFLDGVKVMQIGSTVDYQLVEDYSYQYGPNKITVPKGFTYDRASIPRVFWLLIDKDSLSNVAPLFHDLLYSKGGKLPQNLVSPYRTFSREETDNLFLELMGKCGVVGWRQVAAYEAVRNFAESHWQGH